ncbi:MAG: hypothetical protein QF415_14085 [Candidatus Undinarchaeales archaeon]|jgi:hypothetical protein|nr:hypothetical protein [Candidatus Undinarchaeales archaeon]MDP7493898.1 hypothetical protein [Candidatus Undinarchaeales archaeon]
MDRKFLAAVLIVAALLVGCSSQPPVPPEECDGTEAEKAACVGKYVAYTGDLAPCWKLSPPHDFTCARRGYTTRNDPNLCASIPADRTTCRQDCIVYFGAIMEGGAMGASATPVHVRP